SDGAAHVPDVGFVGRLNLQRDWRAVLPYEREQGLPADPGSRERDRDRAASEVEIERGPAVNAGGVEQIGRRRLENQREAEQLVDGDVARSALDLGDGGLSPVELLGLHSLGQVAL